MIVNTDTQSNSEYVTYEEAAKILDVSIYAVNKAMAIGVFRTIRRARSRVSLIPRWEVEALVGKSVASRHAKELLEELRRQRSGEVQYNEDGTNRWVPESDLQDIVEMQKIIARQQEQMMKDIQEANEYTKRVAEHLLSLDPDAMMREIFADYLARTGK